MEILIIAEITSSILALLVGFLGFRYNKAKKTLKELGMAITTTSKAMEDDKLSAAEIKGILKEWNDVVEVWK